jgi:DNA-binding transcriptional LysR family regulator
MTIDQLRYFLAVAENLNFSSTADVLCISQSSLSKCIKSLEDECAVRLFDRNTRNIRLTDAGIMMKMYAEKILDNYDEMFSSIQRFSDRKRKAFTLYTIPVLSSYGIPKMLIQFSQKNPDISYNIEETDAQFVFKAMETKKADIILMRTHNLNQSGLKLFPILDDELVLVTNRNHRFTKRKAISLHDAANEQFYLLGKSTFMYQLCIDTCIQCGFFPRHVYSEMRLDTIQSFIKQGNRVSLLMEKVADHLVNDEISIVRLKERPVLTLALIMRDEAISDTCIRFIDFATAYFSKVKQMDSK